MPTNDIATPVQEASHRVLLMEELYRRYGAGPIGTSSLVRQVRFWRKKYAWLAVVGGAKVLRRTLDLVGSLTLLICLTPLFLLVALLIKLNDGGPVLFWQVRVGRWGREFPFPKFRSMVVQADQIKDKTPDPSHSAVAKLAGKVAASPGPAVNSRTFLTFKVANDPRITWIGRIIRKTSIDELPQLWCVLKGEMSLVGPRPPVPKEVARYTLQDRRRLDVTGLFSLRENAIAKEPGLSYSESWRCVS